VSQTQKPETVKFKALGLIREAETYLNEAINKLEECKDLGGDNESESFCEALIASIEKDRKTLHRGRFEAQEMW